MANAQTDAAPNIRHRTRPEPVRRSVPPRMDFVRAVGGPVLFEVNASAEDANNPRTMLTALKGMTSQQIQDPFKEVYQAADPTGKNLAVLEPPFNFAALLRMPTENSTLRQCIDAMVTNTEGHGWRLEYIGPKGEEDGDASLAEKASLEDLLGRVNPEMSITEVRERLRRDLETLGNCFYEVGRDPAGDIAFVTHVPAHTMRLTAKDQQPVDVIVELPRGDGVVKVKQRRMFRRYVQLVGTKKVWFKEFGDPRTIDPNTGLENNSLGPTESATEIVHTLFYTLGTPYGTPRWINQLPAIMGSRQAELTNLDFFNDNAVPAMAVLVSGGALTQSSMDQIESHITAIRGRQSYNRVLILEAQGDPEASSEDGDIHPPKLELRPLTGDQVKEGLFLEYEKTCSSKIRSSFRLPPLFVGLSEDYTHATAKSAFSTAESQVFGPERAKSDDVWNNRIFLGRKLTYWNIRANPPRITDPSDVVEALTAFTTAGALTPNIVIGLANEYFDLDIPEVEREWGDWPFDIVKFVAENGRLKGLEDIVDPDQQWGTIGEPGQFNEDAAALDAGKTPPEDTSSGDAKLKKQAQRIVRKSMFELHELIELARERARGLEAGGAANVPAA